MIFVIPYTFRLCSTRRCGRCVMARQCRKPTPFWYWNESIWILWYPCRATMKFDNQFLSVCIVFLIAQSIDGLTKINAERGEFNAWISSICTFRSSFELRNHSCASSNQCNRIEKLVVVTYELYILQSPIASLNVSRKIVRIWEDFKWWRLQRLAC